MTENARTPDVVTLMFFNDDGTITTECTDYTVEPPHKEVRVWADYDATADAVQQLGECSIVVPNEVTL